MSTPTTEPVIDGPATVEPRPEQPGDECHQRTGYTYQSLQPCGWRLEEEAEEIDVYPPQAPPTTVPTAAVVTSAEQPVLPHTGPGDVESSIALLGVLLVAAGLWLRRVGHS